MKKILFTFILTLILGGQSFISAQDLNQLVIDYAISKDAQNQLIDRETLDMSLQAAKAGDTTGALASQIPSFMERIDYIQIVDLTKCSPEIKSSFSKNIEEWEDGNGYETLTSVKDEKDKVKLIARRAESKISEIYLFAMDNELNEVVIIKMSGDLNESDIEDIMKQQKN